MSKDQAIVIQHGIWIDQSQLSEAGLDDHVKVRVEPGEIRIQSARHGTPIASDGGEEPLMRLRGQLETPSLSSNQIDRDLYGNPGSDT